MPQYFDNVEGLKSHKRTINFDIDGKTYSFISDNGVFSKNELDEGTKILIETLLPIDLGGKVLDLGCGYGPIGLVVALNKTMSHVTMCDINERACALVKENAKLLGLEEKVEIIPSDLYQNIKGTFSSIISNPPIRAGNKVLHSLYLGALDHLEDDGALYLVIRRNQGALSTIEFLKEKFKNIGVLRRKRGYYVIKASK